MLVVIDNQNRLSIFGRQVFPRAHPYKYQHVYGRWHERPRTGAKLTASGQVTR
jgi:hypothetical protein